MDAHIAEQIAHAGDLLAEVFQFGLQRLAVAVELALGRGQIVLPALPFGRIAPLLFRHRLRQAFALGDGFGAGLL